MMTIKLICVGRLREKFYTAAADEYIKRLGAFCRIDVEEVNETRVSEKPSKAELDAALMREAEAIERAIPKGARLIAMCIEGAQTDSVGFSEMISDTAGSGASKLCFVIGGSNGIHESIKKRADVRLSMSKMTFPHHLARVMLLEQIYRAFQIMEGGRYHK